MSSGWTYVGNSTGYGRYGRRKQAVSKTAIWLRSVRRDWRRRLGVQDLGQEPPEPPALKLRPSDGLSMEQWVDNEFGAVPFTQALRKQLIKSVRIQSMAPSQAFLSANGSDEAAVTGYYRMIDRPEDNGFTPEAILSAHRERTMKRIRAQRTVLLIEDGCDLNFAPHHGYEG